MSILFEDIFEVKNIDPEGKKFAKGNIVTQHKPSFLRERFFTFILFVLLKTSFAVGMPE